MRTLLLTCACVCLVTITGAVFFVAWQTVLTEQAIQDQFVAMPDLRPVVENANSAMTNANVAFKNLADATGDWSDASKQQARDVRALLAASGRAVDGVTETAHAATRMTQQLTETAQTANHTIAALQPLITHSDELVTAPEIKATLGNVQNITAEGQAVMGDARTVADDATKRYMKPVPWWRKAFPFLTAGAKIASYALPW